MNLLSKCHIYNLKNKPSFSIFKTDLAIARVHKQSFSKEMQMRK